MLAAINERAGSAKLLLDRIQCPDLNKYYLPPSADRSAEAIVGRINNANLDFIIVFTQKPIVGEINIEVIAETQHADYETNYDYKPLSEFLYNKGFRVRISRRAGSRFANQTYAAGLAHIEVTKAHTQYLFIQIPVLINDGELETLARSFEMFLRKNKIIE
jgi:pyrrolidone-carboxylate peptidase